MTFFPPPPYNRCQSWCRIVSGYAYGMLVKQINDTIIGDCIMKLLLMLAGAVACCLTSVAQETWDGGGADTLWSTADNWKDDSAPPNPYTGTIYFANPGMGTNVLDADRQVRYLVYTNNSLEAMHTLDLGGVA